MNLLVGGQTIVRLDWASDSWSQVESDMVTEILCTGDFLDGVSMVEGDAEGVWCSFATFLGCWKRARVHGVPKREVKKVDMTGEVYVSNGRCGRSEVEDGKDWVEATGVSHKEMVISSFDKMFSEVSSFAATSRKVPCSVSMNGLMARIQS